MFSNVVVKKLEKKLNELRAFFRIQCVKNFLKKRNDLKGECNFRLFFGKLSIKLQFELQRNLATTPSVSPEQIESS